MLRVDVRQTTQLIDIAALGRLEQGEALRLMLDVDSPFGRDRRPKRPSVDMPAFCFAAIAHFVQHGAPPAHLDPLARGIVALEARYVGLVALSVECKELFELRERVAHASAGVSFALALLQLGEALIERGGYEEGVACWQRAYNSVMPELILSALHRAELAAQPSCPTTSSVWRAFQLEQIRLLQIGFSSVLPQVRAELFFAAGFAPLVRMCAYTAFTQGRYSQAQAYLSALEPDASGLAEDAVDALATRLRDTARAYLHEPAGACFWAHTAGHRGKQAIDDVALALQSYPRSEFLQLQMACRMEQLVQIAPGDAHLAQLYAAAVQAPCCREALEVCLVALWQHGDWVRIEQLAIAQSAQRPLDAEARALQQMASVMLHRGDGGHQARTHAAPPPFAHPLLTLASAQVAWHAGDISQATSLVEHAALRIDDNARLCRLVAWFFHGLGKPPLALEVMQRHAERSGLQDDALAHDFIAALIAAQNYLLAARWLEMIELWNPSSGSYRRMQIDLLLRASAPDEARGLLSRPLAQQDAELCIAFAESYLRARQPSDALDSVAHVLRVRPHDAGAWALQARAYALAGDAQAALRSMQSAHDAHLDDLSLRVTYAEVLMMTRRWQDALTQVRALVLVYPAARAGFEFLTRCCKRLGLPGLEGQVLRSLPSGPLQQEYLVSYYYYLGCWQLAADEAARGGIEANRTLQTRSIWGDLLGMAGHNQDAEAMLAEAAAQPEAPLGVASRYAIFLHQQGRQKHALAWARYATLGTQADADTFYVYGRLLHICGRHKEALVALRHGLEMYPRMVWAYCEYASVLLTLGYAERAKTYAQKAIDAGESSARARTVLALAHQDIDGSSRAAKLALKDAYKSGERSCALLLAMARVCRRDKKDAHMQRALREAYAIDPMSTELRQMMAELRLSTNAPPFCAPARL